MLADQLRRLQIQLESADEIDVQRVEIRQQWLESEPAPAWDAATQVLAAALGALIMDRDSIVGMRNFDRRGAGRGALQSSYELAR
jgi:hypothetical protein